MSTKKDLVSWEATRAADLSTMTAAERAEYETAAEDADLGLRLAELVYNARKSAGLSQTELARRMGTTQSTISQIEGGGQVPTVATLAKVARATGQDLHLNLPAA